MVLLCAAVALAACGGPSRHAGPAPTRASSASVPSSAPSPSPATASPTAAARGAVTPLTVVIRNFAFVPQNPTVDVGQPIVIVNNDTAAHTWSAAPGSGWTYTSGNLERGQRATFAGFDKPGRYAFVCYYHAEMPAMTGVVTVR